MDIGSDLLPGGGPIFDIGRDVYNMFTGRRRRQNPQKSGGYTETAAERKRRLEKSSGN